jgi:hypothetical protein
VRFFDFSVMVLSLLLLPITGCHGGPEKAHEEPLPIASVRVQSVESLKYPVTEDVVGPRDFKVAACVAVRGPGSDRSDCYFKSS